MFPAARQVCCNSSRAREMRDLTVPREISSTAAISSYVRPSISLSTMAARSFGDNRYSARWICSRNLLRFDELFGGGVLGPQGWRKPASAPTVAVARAEEREEEGLSPAVDAGVDRDPIEPGVQRRLRTEIFKFLKALTKTSCAASSASVAFPSRYRHSVTIRLW